MLILGTARNSTEFGWIGEDQNRNRNRQNRNKNIIIIIFVSLFFLIPHIWIKLMPGPNSVLRRPKKKRSLHEYVMYYINSYMNNVTSTNVCILYLYTSTMNVYILTARVCVFKEFFCATIAKRVRIFVHREKKAIVSIQVCICGWRTLNVIRGAAAGTKESRKICGGCYYAVKQYMSYER